MGFGAGDGRITVGEVGLGGWFDDSVDGTRGALFPFNVPGRCGAWCVPNSRMIGSGGTYGCCRGDCTGGMKGTDA